MNAHLENISARMKTGLVPFAVALALLCSGRTQARGDGGWWSRPWSDERLDEIPRCQMPLNLQSEGFIPPETTQRNGGKRGNGASVSFSPSGLAGQLPPAGDSRILELARGLDHDWERCFKFVRDHIAYVPYPGIVKGPERTLLDREGNDADQAFLLCALLRASGYGTATVLYVPLRDTGTELESGFVLPRYNIGGTAPYNAVTWLGETSNGGIAAKFRASGVPFSWVGTEYIGIEHYWVVLTVDGGTIHLDPSIKRCTSQAAKDAVTASGYNRTNFLSAVGGTIDANSARNLSSSGVDSYLVDRVADLKAAWTAPGASPQTVLGGQSIIPYEAGEPRFHGRWVEENPPIDLLAAPASTLNALRMPILLDSSGEAFKKVGTATAMDLFFYLDEVGSRTLWFGLGSGGDLGFFADGTEIAHSPTNQASVGVDVRFTNAPSFNSYAVQAAEGQVYVLGVHFGAGLQDGMRKSVVRNISELRRSGVGDTDARMLAETLHLQAQQWFSQVALHRKVWDRVAGGDSGYYYNIGIAGQSTGPFVDMGNSYSRGRGGTGLVNSDMLFSSALEHSVIEQLNGSDTEGVSTVKLLAVANGNGFPIYFADSNNVDAVVSSLNGYPDGKKTSFATLARNGGVFLLPRNGNITLNNWTGMGYVEHGDSGDGSVYTGMMISGGLNGGWLSDSGQVDRVSYVDQSYRFQQYQDVSDGQSEQVDPVSMPAGAYTDHATDLTIRRAWPLAWSRSYDTRSAETDGDLGHGWTHGFEAGVSVSSDADAALGSASLEAMLPAVVATVAAEDLMEDEDGLAPGERARRWTAAALVADWWTKQLPQTCVTVKLGAQTMAFQKMPDGTHAAGPGVTAALEQSPSGLYTLRERHGNAYAFNADGKLETITDPNGNVTVLAYADGKLSRVDNPFGASLSVVREESGRIASVTDNTGKCVRYAYGTDGCLEGVTDVAGNLWTYAYDSATRMMTGKWNPDGACLVSNVYNSFGQVVTQTLANGQTWQLGYAAAAEAWNEDPKGGRLTETFDSNARVVARMARDGAEETAAYEGHGHPSVALNAAGTQTSFAYDARDNLLSSTEGTGVASRSTRFGYDAEDRLVAATNALGEVTRYEYDACHRVLKATAADGTYLANVWNPDGTLAESGSHAADGTLLLRTVYAYETYGLPVSVTVYGDGLPTEGITTTTEYNADGTVAATTDALGHRAVCGYDAAGRLVSVTDALGNTSSFEYDKEGRIVAATDALGRVTRTVYNASGLPVLNTNPDGTTTSIVYDEVEDVLETTDERGARTTFDRDTEGRPVAVMDALGNVAQTRYDVLGRPVWAQDASGVEAWTAYDAFSRPVETRDALGAMWTTSFDKLDRPVSATSPLGQTTRAEYNKAGQLVRSVRASGAAESFGYDAAGNQTAYTNSEGHVYRMTYDPLGRMVAATNALGERVAAMTYDANGNLIRVEDGNGAVRTFGYDALNRLVRQNSPDGTNTFGYDAVGNLTNAVNDTAAESFEYDAMDRLIAASTAVGGISVRQTWQRDAGGLVTNLSYGTGLSVARRYDAAGRLVAVDAGNGRVWTFAWDGAGRLVRMTSPDGRESCRSYDAAERLVSWNDGELIGRAIEYDAAGRKTCDHVTAGPMPAPATARHAENTFDAADRLVSSSLEQPDGTTRAEAFSYDGNGALVRTESGEEIVTFRYNADMSLGGITAGGTEAAFAYDALGNRVIAGGHVWIPDQNDALKRPLLEFDAEGTFLRSYIWAGGTLLGYVEADGSLVVAHADEQGGVIALSLADGTVFHTALYGPHGENWGRTGDNPTPFAWLGGFGVQRLPQDTFLGGLYLTRHRLYSPAQQRFLSADPLGLAGGLNLYSYGNGNPIVFVDPWGLCSKKSWWDGTVDYLEQSWDAVLGYGDAWSDNLLKMLYKVTFQKELYEDHIHAMDVRKQERQERWDNGMPTSHDLGYVTGNYLQDGFFMLYGGPKIIKGVSWFNKSNKASQLNKIEQTTAKQVANRMGKKAAKGNATDSIKYSGVNPFEQPRPSRDNPFSPGKHPFQPWKDDPSPGYHPPPPNPYIQPQKPLPGKKLDFPAYSPSITH